MMAELSQILPNLGAKSCKTDTVKRESENLFTVTAEYILTFACHSVIFIFYFRFEKAEHVLPIYNLWQLATTNQATCTIADE
jgi:hypothetical protein